MPSSREQRVELANRFLLAISEHGRRFFRHAGTDIGHPDCVSFFEMDRRGRIWFIDSYSGARIYTHKEGRWRGFTNGGNLLNLCKALRDYIMGRDELPMSHLGPWPPDLCGGDLWAYGESMQLVREKCAALAEGTT